VYIVVDTVELMWWARFGGCWS